MNPRNITTAEELDKLPVGSVVLEVGGKAFQRADEYDDENETDSLWSCDSNILFPPHCIEMPTVVLWEPNELDA